MKHTKLLTLASCLVLSLGLVGCDDIPAVENGGGGDEGITEPTEPTEPSEPNEPENPGTPEVTVESVTLSASELSFEYEDIASGVTKTLTATVIGSDGEVMIEEEVGWSSSETSVATVIEGVVTPIGSGSATITATSVTDPSKSAECAVKVASYVEPTPDPGTGDEPGGGGSGGEPGEGGEPEPVYVTSLTFNETEYDVVVGETANYTISVTPEDATDPTYSIKVVNVSGIEDNSVASASDGVITGVSAGEAYIVATANDNHGGTGYAKIVVTKAPISSISVYPTSTAVAEEEGFTIGPSDSEATIKVTTGPDDPLDGSWYPTTTDTDKLSISQAADQDGKWTVTALENSEEGTTTATVSVVATANSEVKDDITVTITKKGIEKVDVTSISVNPTTYAMDVSDSFTIGTAGEEPGSPDVAVTIEPETATIQTYSVNIDDTDKAYLEVSSKDSDTGYVTVKALEGSDNQTVTLSIISDDSAYTTPAALEVSINKLASEVTTVNVSNNTGLSVETEKTLDLSTILGVTVLNQYGDEMQPTEYNDWSLVITEDNDSTGAKVGEGGKSIVASYYTGTIKVAVKVGEVPSSEFEIEIVQDASNIHPTGITYISGEDGNFTITEGKTIDFDNYVEVTPADATIGTYTVTEAEPSSGCITIEGSVVTANKYGSATITIALTDQTFSPEPLTAYITIEESLSNVTISLENDSINKNGTTTATATIYPADLDGVTYQWSSSNTDVATISGSGASATISGVAAGTTEIKVVATEGSVSKEASTTLTVNALVESIALSSSKEDNTYTEGETVTITATVNSDATDPSLAWSSESEGVDLATVGNGTEISFTAPTLGESEESRDIVIKATAQDGSNVSGEITITVKPVLATTMDVTLSVTFNDSVPSYAKLYFMDSTMTGQNSSSWDTSISEAITLDSNTYTRTYTGVAIGTTIDYAFALDYDREAYNDAPENAITIVYNSVESDSSVSVTPGGSGTTKADYNAISETISSNVTLGNILTEPTDTKTGITLKIYLYENETNLTNGNAQEIPTWYDCWIGASTANDNTWNDHAIASPNYTTKEGHMSVDSDAGGYYLSYTFQGAISTGTIYYYLQFERSSDEENKGFTWGHEIADLSFEISQFAENNSTIEEKVVTGHDLSSWITETANFSVTVALKNSDSGSSNVSFYLDGLGDSSWTSTRLMSTSSGDYDRYITDTGMDNSSDITFWVGGTKYTWNHGIMPSEDTTFTWTEDYCYGSMSGDTWKFELGKMNGDSWTNAESLTIVLTLSFSAFNSNSDSNGIVTNIQCIY